MITNNFDNSPLSNWKDTCCTRKTRQENTEKTYIFFMGRGSSIFVTDDKGTTVCWAGLFIPLANLASICSDIRSLIDIFFKFRHNAMHYVESKMTENDSTLLCAMPAEQVNSVSRKTCNLSSATIMAPQANNFSRRSASSLISHLFTACWTLDSSCTNSDFYVKLQARNLSTRSKPERWGNIKRGEKSEQTRN